MFFFNVYNAVSFNISTLCEIKGIITYLIDHGVKFTITHDFNRKSERRYKKLFLDKNRLNIKRTLKKKYSRKTEIINPHQKLLNW